MIALSALDLGTMFGGALLTETLFGIPGLGQQLVQSVQLKDLPVVVGDRAGDGARRGGRERGRRRAVRRGRPTGGAGMTRPCWKSPACGSSSRPTAGRVRAVDGLDFTLGEGEALGLVGESGSGKSATAYALLGLHRGTGARVSGVGTGRRHRRAHRLRRGVAAAARRGRRDGLPGPAVLARPLLRHRRPDRRGPPGPPPRLARRRPGPARSRSWTGSASPTRPGGPGPGRTSSAAACGNGR